VGSKVRFKFNLLKKQDSKHYETRTPGKANLALPCEEESLSGHYSNRRITIIITVMLLIVTSIIACRCWFVLHLLNLVLFSSGHAFV
jgi:hypothetical protein